MARAWEDIPIRNKYFGNVHETVLTTAQAAIENAFHNESGGLSRFPGLVAFTGLPDVGRVYLTEWRGHMIAVTDEGRLYRIDEAGNVENKTGVPISSDRRIIFDRTGQQLLIAGGAQIFQYDGETTKVLSTDAPLATHVGFVDSYVVANERNSGVFQHSDPGLPNKWPALNIFAADSRPDDINALLVTEFNELLVGGSDTIEQWERLASGVTPFFRRWSVGEGVLAPYTMVFADNAVSVVNKRAEFVRISGQTGQVQGDDVSLILESITDWNDAWSVPMFLKGQKFILLQIPKHVNVYGTLGITLIYDFRQRRWFNLFDWDEVLALPTNWPGDSYLSIWGKHYVGCAGRVCRFDFDTFSNEGRTQRMMLRTAHLDKWGPGEIVNVRARLRRGVGDNTINPVIGIRCRRDNKVWTRLVKRGLGKSGEREPFIEFGPMGKGHTFQFEIIVTDDALVELVKLEVQVLKDG